MTKQPSLLPKHDPKVDGKTWIRNIRNAPPFAILIAVIVLVAVAVILLLSQPK